MYLYCVHLENLLRWLFFLKIVFVSFVSTGVLPADHENETQRPEEASDGEVSGGGGPGLRRGGQVSSPWGQMYSGNE